MMLTLVIVLTIAITAVPLVIMVLARRPHDTTRQALLAALTWAAFVFVASDSNPTRLKELVVMEIVALLGIVILALTAFGAYQCFQTSADERIPRLKNFAVAYLMISILMLILYLLIVHPSHRIDSHDDDMPTWVTG